MTTENEQNNRNWKNYIPLLMVIALSSLAAAALSGEEGAKFLNLLTWMHAFMGMFLLFFALFKFINLPGFADGFSMYDLLASRWRGYGFIYPFLELGLSLSYLSDFPKTGTYIATILIMSFGALGVLNALRKKLRINCACLGTVLNVPLSTVAVVENLGMVVMAAVMLFFVQ